jgi:hypothetical protein
LDGRGRKIEISSSLEIATAKPALTRGMRHQPEDEVEPLFGCNVSADAMSSHVILQARHLDTRAPRDARVAACGIWPVLPGPRSPIFRPCQGYKSEATRGSKLATVTQLAEMGKKFTAFQQPITPFAVGLHARRNERPLFPLAQAPPPKAPQPTRRGRRGVLGFYSRRLMRVGVLTIFNDRRSHIDLQRM